MTTTQTMQDRIADVRQRIALAAERADRSASGITLVAVSKTFPDARVRRARELGLVDFGESRPQSLASRLEADPPLSARWHFVGRLQRNKVDLVCGRATLIHSVDRISLASEIAEMAAGRGAVQRVLVQVNISDDANKGGFTAAEVPMAVSRIREMPGISVQGLMTIPALDADTSKAFGAMRQLRDTVRESFPEVLHLSMGMSADFETAIEQGATLVRIGTGIFGPRD